MSNNEFSKNESFDVLKNKKMSTSIYDNIALFNDILKDDETLKIRNIKNKCLASKQSFIIYMDGMVDNNFISENIINCYVNATIKLEMTESNLLNTIKTEVLVSNDINESNDLHYIIESLLEGNTLFLIDGFASILIISSKGLEYREITEPDSEKIVRGPREGFTESLMTNISLVRRKIKHPNLKFKFRLLGELTTTRICICYIDGIVSNTILDELYKKLDKISLTSVLASEYIAEMLNDSPLSIFETFGSTERPDVVAGKIFEGRVALFVDGTPFVLTVPFLFLEYFQISEDYYINYLFTSFNRLIRFLSFLFSISIPAIYLSFVTYNQEMIPAPLLLSIYAARENVPFPTVAESFLMLFVFEILREAGSRVPSNMGQAISIVGALVLGQAAVEARIVSAPMVIVVGLTGIAGILNFKIKTASIVLRIILLLLSSFLGMYGYIFGCLGIIIYLMNLNSFGIPYMSGTNSLKPDVLKDSLIRFPWQYLSLKPYKITIKNKKRN